MRQLVTGGTPRWDTRSLLPKLFGAFVAVLALASLVTLFVETRLTRNLLESQAEELSREQGATYRRQLNDAFTAVGELRRVVSTATSQNQSPLVALRTAPTRGLVVSDVAQIIDATTGETIEATSRRRIEVSRADLAGDGALFRTRPRVVPTADASGDDRWSFVYTLPLPGIERPLLLAVGSPLDEEYARRIRELTGTDHVEIVVDGELVASTDARHTGATPSADWTEQATPLRADEGDRLVQYVRLTSAEGWGQSAVVGLLVDDPLAPLDSRLTVYRSLMVGLLLLLGGLLAFAFVSVLTRPLTRLTQTAGAIAGGDLEASFEVDRRDEIGQLADALERMRRGLRAQLLVIRDQASALQEAARRVVGERDRERQRLALDLHDGIQQRLVVLRMQVGAARTRIRRDPAEVEAVAEELGEAIDQILDELRATGQALYPAILRDRGLGGALHSLAARTEVLLALHLEPDPLPRLPEDLEANAYFLVSEAVTNALKHADARRIRLDVRLDDDGLHVLVEDDGRGFTPEMEGHRGGLQHLRDRVNALAGTLQVNTAPDVGTRIRVLLPVAEPRSPALEVEQHGGDTSVELELLGEPELPEDGVGVLLDRPVRDGQLPGDRGVPPS
ncbi:HAMP domain-containing protein [Nitriliruptoraceae bacterium ZYF776]|nr:HAMP domain-containing protein [Profundirhabdus halotolerans]